MTDPVVRAERIARAALLRSQGLSILAIAAKMGTSNGTAHRLLVAAGKPERIRPPEPAPLTDAQWEAVRSVLSRHAARNAVDASLWLHSDCGRVVDLPTGFGSWRTAYHRYRRWMESGVLDAILAALKECP